MVLLIVLISSPWSCSWWIHFVVSKEQESSRFSNKMPTIVPASVIAVSHIQGSELLGTVFPEGNLVDATEVSVEQKAGDEKTTDHKAPS